MERGDLQHRFTYFPPKEDQVAKYRRLRQKAFEFADLINEVCPDSREKSLAVTHIEESVFWANAAIARNE